MLDGLEYLRTATLGLPYPDHAGKRVVVIGGASPRWTARARRSARALPR